MGIEGTGPPLNVGQHAPLSGGQLILAGLLLALANFMVVLDTTIANVSVPNIAGGLAVSPSQGTWVITSYGVAEAITVPLTGWLAKRFGPVRVFSPAMLSFAFWSMACGLAPSLGALVACRVLQGLSGGPMVPLSQALLLRVLRRVRDAIEAHLSEDINLPWLAGIAGCSPAHFSRAFKQSTGMSPSQRLAGRRMEKAKALLGDPALSLAEIALAVGFSAQPQFTTAFRRTTGAPPGAWRRDLAI